MLSSEQYFTLFLSSYICSQVLRSSPALFCVLVFFLNLSSPHHPVLASRWSPLVKGAEVLASACKLLCLSSRSFPWRWREDIWLYDSHDCWLILDVGLAVHVIPGKSPNLLGSRPGPESLASLRGTAQVGCLLGGSVPLWDLFLCFWESQKTIVRLHLA